MALECQIKEYTETEKGKSKAFLVNMADGQDKALTHTVFSSWLGLMQKARAEKDIRKKFEDQIALCEKRLFQYKEAQIANVRGVIMRSSMEEQSVLMHMVWKFWLDEVAEH